MSHFDHDKCSRHGDVMESLDAMKIAIQTFSEWRAVDEFKQDQSDRQLTEILTSLKNITESLNEIKVSMNRDYATWKAHDRLKEQVAKQNEDLKKFVMKIFTLGITIAGAVFGFVQWVLSVSEGGG